ncbi:MAG: DMT family transporter [Ferrovibrionaceae bacterium]
MPIGILAALATCALWGLTFVAPRAVLPYGLWDLLVARYGLFGLASAAMMLHPRFRPGGLGTGRWLIGLALGSFGYVGYFACAAYAVRHAGATIPPLVIGLMPVVLAVLGNLRERVVPWRFLGLPLALITLGLGLVNIRPTGGVEAGGVLAAVGALAIWVIYGMVNAAVMRAADAPDSIRWTGAQGIGAGIASLALLPLTTWPAAAPAEMVAFAGWAVALGLAGSWLATLCWVVASRRLPLALSAQLVVAETVFGLAYGFLFEARWPTPPEWGGAGLQVAGVVIAIALFSRRRGY